MSGIKDLNKMSQAELAMLWGCSTRTIQRKPELEQLRHGSGVGCYYVWSECRAYELTQLSQSIGADGVTDRQRKDAADANIREMEEAQMAGTLVNAQEASEALVDVLTRLRPSLRGFPGRMLKRIEDVAEFRERLEIGNREMDATLREITAMIPEDQR